jgi:hypothetical protein
MKMRHCDDVLAIYEMRWKGEHSPFMNLGFEATIHTRNVILQPSMF